MGVRIFINYRRDDSIATAGRLHDKLARAFGRKSIFMDIDHIPAGVDFVRYLRDQVQACDVILALIGPHWLDARDGAGLRRIDNPDDFVVLEIASALSRDVRVIPVLLDGARMPAKDLLPPALEALTYRNAVELRNSQFGRDSDVLIERIREASPASWASPRIRWSAAALAMAAAMLVAVWAYSHFSIASMSPAGLGKRAPDVAAFPARTDSGTPKLPLGGAQGASFAIKSDTQVLVIQPYWRGFENREKCEAKCAAELRCRAYEVSQQCRLYAETPTTFTHLPVRGWTVGVKN